MDNSYMDWMDRDYEFEQQREQEREEKKELKELKVFLDAQIYLTEILDGGYSVYESYDLDEKGEKLDKSKKYYEFLDYNDTFKSKNSDFLKAFWDFYYQVVEWEIQQEEEKEEKRREEEEKTYLGETAEYWRNYWGRKEREWIESTSDDDFGF